MQHEEYGSYIAESLYAMVNLNQDLSMKKCNSMSYLYFCVQINPVIIQLFIK